MLYHWLAWGVQSPTSKTKWNRETISKILENEKYTGDVILGKTKACNGVQMKKKDQDITMLLDKAEIPGIICNGYKELTGSYGKSSSILSNPPIVPV